MPIHRRQQLTQSSILQSYLTNRKSVDGEPGGVQPFLYQKQLLDYCEKTRSNSKHTVPDAGREAEHPKIQSIAKKHDKTPAQVPDTAGVSNTTS